MRKEHLHATVERRLFDALNRIWRIEQEKALKRGESVSKSSVVEEVLRLGVREYCKRHKVTELLQS